MILRISSFVAVPMAVGRMLWILVMIHARHRTVHRLNEIKAIALHAVVDVPFHYVIDIHGGGCVVHEGDALAGDWGEEHWNVAIVRGTGVRCGYIGVAVSVVEGGVRMDRGILHRF